MIRPPPSLDTSLVEEGSVSAGILHLVHWMDEYGGAAEWGTRQVGMVTVVVLGIIRFTCKDAYGVTWYQFVHAIVSGYLSFLAVWLNFFEAETLTGTSEPLRSFLCQGPLTSLHRILPAITMGFGFFDILDGIGHGFDFVSGDFLWKPHPLGCWLAWFVSTNHSLLMTLLPLFLYFFWYTQRCCMVSQPLQSWRIFVNLVLGS